MKLDASKQNLLVDVIYGGGCKEHNFTLKLGGCLESYPAQCSAELVDSGAGDACEAMVSKTAVISLAAAGLKDSYFSKAYLTILGDVNWQTQKKSSATVQLP